MTVNMSNLEEIESKVEAILFSYGDWIDLELLKSLLKNSPEEKIKSVLDKITLKFEKGYSFKVEFEEIEDVDSKIMKKRWRMALKEEFNDLITDFVSGFEMPKSALKVLSVIAYEQPVTKTRLSEILGKSVKEDVNYLYKAKFLTYEKNGIGKYYRVTKKFYDYFKMDENVDFRVEANKSMKVNLDIGNANDEIENKNEKARRVQIQEEDD